MKYLEALKKRNLSLINLPKTLQKKIEELNFQVDTLKQIEESASEELGENELADIEIVKSSIKELDSHVEHKINIFDQAKYQEKLDKISLMTKAKKEMKEGGLVKQQEVEVKEPEIEVAEPVVTKAVAIEPEQKKAPAPVVENTYVPTPTPAPQPVYEEQQEEDEFERKGDGNPKKMTTGLILMGVGAFFLTWGAVNFFKSRR